MQTFMPYSDFTLVAKCLDNKRLGKQRVECTQILDCLEGRSFGWNNHPITCMWQGYTDALKQYTNCMITEWINRGFQNTIPLYEIPEIIEYPKWIYCDKILESHQSQLNRKMPEHYSFDVEPYLLYVWLVATENRSKRLKMPIGSLYTSVNNKRGKIGELKCMKE